MTVSELSKGDIVQIVEFTDNKLGLQLSQMGFLVGETIQYLSAAPLGDPICIATSETQLSIRRDAASTIIVQKVATL